MKYRTLMLVGLVSRLVVVAMGCTLAWTEIVPAVGSADPRKFDFPQVEADLALRSRRWIAPWYRWDAQWYARISLEGYTYDPANRYTPVVFLPLLPVLMSLSASLGLDRYWVGLILPNLAFVVGLNLFARIAFRLTGDVGTVRRSCLLLIVYPWSFYFSAPYQESLGFALSAAAVLAWMSLRPLATAVASATATAARLTSAALPLAILCEWGIEKLRGRPTRPYAWPVALAGGLGALVFFVFCYLRFGEFFLPLKAQSFWGRKPPSLANALHALLWPPRTLNNLKDYGAVFLFLGFGLRALRKRGVFWGCLILIPILQPLSSGLTLSITRLALMAYPGFIEAGELTRNRFIFGAIVAAGLVLQTLMIKNFVG